MVSQSINHVPVKKCHWSVGSTLLALVLLAFIVKMHLVIRKIKNMITNINVNENF